VRNFFSGCSLSEQVCLPATPRGQYFLRIPAPIGSPVRLWSKKGAGAWPYSSLGNQSEIKKLFLESKLSPWIFTARSTLYVILLSASPSLSWRSMRRFVLFALFKMVKMAFKKISQEIEQLQNLNYA
jgi:hypothetical protein